VEGACELENVLRLPRRRVLVRIRVEAKDETRRERSARRAGDGVAVHLSKKWNENEMKKT